MNENFEKIGPKLDGISQKIEKLTLSIKGLILEFGKLNENISNNLLKISRQIITYHENINDSASDDFEKGKALLNEIQNDLDKYSNLPTTNIIDLNKKLEMVLSIIGNLVDPDTLQEKILKIKNYLIELK